MSFAAETRPVPNSRAKVFLSQGICAGIGAGLLYILSIAVISHYFNRRRVLAMSIVAAGSSLGSVVHPIMLNNMLDSSLGFGNSVRASAGLVAGMLLLAIVLMKPRLPPPAHTTPLVPAIKKFSRDSAYVWTSIGYGPCIAFALRADIVAVGCSWYPRASTTPCTTYSLMPPSTT